MTKTELIDTLNHAAASLLVAGERYPAKVREMRQLAVRLQIMAMDMAEPWQEDGIANLSAGKARGRKPSHLT